MSPPIEIVAAVIRDEDGRTLLVRKQGTQVFMQPGESASRARTTSRRWRASSTRNSASPSLPARSGASAASAPAPPTNPGREVVAAVYDVAVAGTAVPRAEIAELLWFDPRDPPRWLVAPLTADHILRLS